MTSLLDPTPHLHGAEGELVVIRISADARHLEDVLEAVAELPFPINPEIYHVTPQESRVEFPAYSQRVEEVRAILALRGLPADCLQVTLPVFAAQTE